MAKCMAGLETIESSDYHGLWTNIIHEYLLTNNDHALKLACFPSFTRPLPRSHVQIILAMSTYHGSSHQTQAETWQDGRVLCHSMPQNCLPASYLALSYLGSLAYLLYVRTYIHMCIVLKST
jgi:hypothetical protein